jgi:DNA-binding SARP family transcriptional activator/predicted ATPase
MRVRVLGPFHLDDGGRQITIGGVRQRAVLADLLLHANEVVPSEQLLVDLWGEDSPPSAANALQAAIHRLRRTLPPGRLITSGPGYLLRLFPAELDAAQFEQLIFEGRDALAAGAATEAAQLLDQAMLLWRGPPLADFRYEPFAQAEIARLEELQLACLEERNDARLALGSASALTAELGRMVAGHPTRERLRGQLMLALYRSGRQTEALEAYREFRSVLAEELGLEPSSALRKLEEAILRHDPVLAPGPVTSGAPLARRPVTVLCVALQVAPGSAAALDPEAHGVVHEHVVSALTAVLERHGGELAASDGEHLMGLFGVTTLHEDDALRAARASLEAREALTGEAAVPRHYGAHLVYRFGLATGEALVGGPGPLGFAGDVGARAVTLAEAAGQGQILIGPQVRQLAAGAIEVEEAGPDRFLLRSAHAALRPLAPRLDVPLVGRGEEMRRLEAAYARATHERATFTVRVIGEAGLGKTRLVQEFAGKHGREAYVLTGRCLHYGEGITFWPLREVVRQAAGGDSPEEIKAMLGGQADGATVSDQLHRALGPGTQGRTAAAEIFWAARRFLEALARRRPVLAVFEDVHWAEPTFLDLVESLALQPGGSPMLLVCLARPELLDQRPAWAAEADRTICIQLTPLGEGPANALLDSVSAGQHMAPATRARLIDTAGGNPLYLEQLTVSLSEQSGSDVRLALPPTIQALLAARLQRLGPGASSALARAAIVGKDFGEQAVRELLPVEAHGPLSRNLQTLVDKGLVQRGPPGRIPAEEYSFRHILIQEAAYRAIPKSLRAELHHRFADWLETIVANAFTGRSEILGYHLEKSVRYRNELRPADPQTAGLSLRAAAHLDTAGCAAHDRGDDVAAVNLLDRAAALLPGDDPALGRLYTVLGTALIEARQFEKAKATLDHAQHITAATGDERQNAHARVQALLLHLKVSPSEAEMDIARALPGLHSYFEACHDDRGICNTLQLEGELHWDHCRSAAAEYAWQRAADHARKVNDRRQLADILNWLASAALWGPTPAPLGIQRCKDYLDEIGNHPIGRAEILLNLAGLYAMHDDFAAAQATLGAAKSMLEALGPTMTAAMTQPAALIAMLAGDPVTAERYLRLEYDSLYQMGERRFLPTTAAELARAIAAQGPSRYDEAIELLDMSREAAADADLSPQVVGQGLRARILADQGCYGEAIELARSAAALAAQTDLLSEHADTVLELAHVLAAAGQAAEAHSAANEALDMYQRKGNLPGARESLRYLTQSATT